MGQHGQEVVEGEAGLGGIGGVEDVKAGVVGGMLEELSVGEHAAVVLEFESGEVVPIAEAAVVSEDSVQLVLQQVELGVKLLFIHIDVYINMMGIVYIPIFTSDYLNHHLSQFFPVSTTIIAYPVFA